MESCLRFVVCVLIFAAFFDSALSASAAWSYDGSDGPAPAQWHTASGYHRCNDTVQSPVDIQTKDVTYDASLTPIVMDDYYNQAHNMTMVYVNNKHSAKVELTGDFLIHGGGLPYQYKAKQFHFHWGSVNTKGSEHTVDGKSYPMELHIVHHNTNWTSIAEAADKPFGLAVLGFFFEIVDKANADYHWLTDYRDNIKYGGQQINLPAFDLHKLLPQDFEHYYRYEGSLTTPPCYESATWTVFQETIKISQAQLDSFRGLFFTENGTNPGRQMVDNYRPVQPLHGRKVTTSTAPATTPTGPVGSASVARISIIAIGTLTIMVKFILDRQ